MSNKDIELKIEVKGNALEELDKIKQQVDQIRLGSDQILLKYGDQTDESPTELFGTSLHEACEEGASDD